jgi:hypothetical protein
MFIPRLFVLQAVCLGLFYQAFARQMLQQTPSLSCGALDKNSVEPPENAVLYLSVRGPGTITYKCVEANKPVVLEESAELNESISKGWSGKIETKDGARILTTTNGNEKPPATNVFVLGPDPTSRNTLNGAPDLRWSVTSNTGASAAAGGIPAGSNYVTRTQAEGGAPPRSCDAGETIKVPFSAAYNIYSCDEAYLSAAPGPSVTAPAPGPSVTVSTPSPATVAITPSPSALVPKATSPISVPPVAVTPTPTPSPTPAPVVTVTVPSPAPGPVPAPSSATSATGLIGAAVMLLGALMA